MSRKYREPRTIRTDVSYYNSPEWFKLRDEVLERDGFICRYCGGDAVTADHVKPRSRRGTDELNNLVAACSTCNAYFRAIPFDTFEEKLEYYEKFYVDKKVSKELEQYRNAIKGKSSQARRAIRESFAAQGKKTRRSSRKFQCARCSRTSRTGTNWPSTELCPYHND